MEDPLCPCVVSYEYAEPLKRWSRNRTLCTCNSVRSASSHASLGRETVEISWGSVCRADLLPCDATSASDSCSCAEKLCYRSCRETLARTFLSSPSSTMRYGRSLLRSCLCDHFYVPNASSCACEGSYQF